MNAQHQDPAERPAAANDSVDGEAATGPGPATDRVAELEAEVSALKDQYLRAVAEAENIRRRGERERQDVAKYAATNLARDMLSVADNLRRALDALPGDAVSDDKVRSFVEGVELTERELIAAFGRHGIERVAPMDVPFDPNRHQAMFEVPGTGKPNGTVVQCLQAGWMMHDRLLRPALVGVAKSAAAAPVSPLADDEPTLG